MHVGGLHHASSDSKARVIESISPVNKDWGVWQARDNYIGASWIIALGSHEILQLTNFRNNGDCWKLYKPCSAAQIIETNNFGNFNITASVASFHDTKHDLAPPALLRIGNNFVYRNASGHTVPVNQDLVHEILELNNIVL